jgi:DEAD/DEAH box helicase domain-containing protein
MIPSILTSQIRGCVEDFLQTTFPPSNRFFHCLLDRLIAKEGGLFRGLFPSPIESKVVHTPKVNIN